jgi:hypothetical protein
MPRVDRCRRGSSNGSAEGRMGQGPRLIAGENGHANAWRTLSRAGDCAAAVPAARAAAPLRVALPRRSPPHRQQALRPLHPHCHAVTGDFHRSGRKKRLRIGSRIGALGRGRPPTAAYSELHRDKKAADPGRRGGSAAGIAPCVPAREHELRDQSRSPALQLPEQERITRSARVWCRRGSRVAGAVRKRTDSFGS